MASTYTANLGIEKPGSGEQSGTWGTTTNTNFDIIDRAINGVVALTLTGTTTTLTTSDGALSDGGYRVLVLSGSPSGTNTITISPNDQDKLYLVHNNTNQSAIFSQGSGANATVPAGDFAWVFADGAGAAAAVTLVTVDTSQLADSSITSAKIVDGTIATADIADDAVTSAKIADATIVAGNIATDTITATQIAADAVGSSELAANAVDTAAIASTAVTTAKIANDAVTQAKIADDAVGADQLASNAVVNASVASGAAIAFSKMANLTTSRALVSDGNGDVSVSAVTSTEIGYLDGVTSNVQTQINNIAGYPQVITTLTSGTSYTIPSDAQAILIRASGGGGGGSVHANPGTGGLGTNSVTLGGDGGTTTVTNSTLGIAITAKGGPNGTNLGSDAGTGNWFTNVGSGSTGGDVFYNVGASGGRSTTNNFDGGLSDGGNGVVVQKYVTGNNVGGQTLSYSLGAGGTATSSGGSIQPEPGRGGFIEITVW